MARKAATPKFDKSAPSTGEKVQVNRLFTPEEFRERTTEMARTHELIQERELRWKADSASAKAEIKELQRRRDELVNQLRTGYEKAVADAEVVFDRKKGIKHYFYHCPGNAELHRTFIKTDTMTEADYQLLPLPVEEQAKDLEQKMKENQVDPSPENPPNEAA